MAVKIPIKQSLDVMFLTVYNSNIGPVNATTTRIVVVKRASLRTREALKIITCSSLDFERFVFTKLVGQCIVPYGIRASKALQAESFSVR